MNLLQLIYDNPGTSLTELAKLSGEGFNTTKTKVDRLEQQGFIESGRRYQHRYLYVTAAGSRAVLRGLRESELPVAGPRCISVMTGHYVPPMWVPVRPGADKHLECGSRGIGA